MRPIPIDLSFLYFPKKRSNLKPTHKSFHSYFTAYFMHKNQTFNSKLKFEFVMKRMMVWWWKWWWNTDNIIVPSSSLSSSNRDGGEAILEQNGKGEIQKQMSKKRTKYYYKHLQPSCPPRMWWSHRRRQPPVPPPTPSHWHLARTRIGGALFVVKRRKGNVGLVTSAGTKAIRVREVLVHTTFVSFAWADIRTRGFVDFASS